ncbi:MAG TPA: methyltransferase domain-containing protein [Terracidiphilus sp.]|nr:methyltransferase domain-containing protein [Terracidiphilus sp.]
MKHWLERKQAGGKAASAQSSAPRFKRYSGAWSTLRKRLLGEAGLRVIDAGATSPTNINYLTGLGHSVYMADLVHDGCAGHWTSGDDEDGNPIWDADAFLTSCLNFSGKKFDIVLLWTTLDYLPEPLVAPVVQRLHESMNPGGLVLAFFHTRTQGEETVNCRFHITDTDEVEVQVSEPFPIQRAFTNRSIERLFSGWSGHRQFLAKDSLSEVLMTR